MAAVELLPSFPLLRTRDTEELRAWLMPAFNLRNCDFPHRRPSDISVFNHGRVGSLELTFARYGTALRAHLEQNDYFVQGFPVTGNGEVCWNHLTFQVRPGSSGVVGGPGARADIAYSDDFSHLILKIAPAAVLRRLSLLIDRPIDPPLELTGQLHPAQVQAQFRLVHFLVGEMENTASRLADIVLHEIEDAIILGFLTSCEHNYSHLLDGEPRAAAPWQVRRAVDYMEAHWDEPITIELLTRITETSARSLFQLFKKTHDVSPMVYLSKARLRHAKEMLSRPGDGTSVTKVGFMCGFSNMGHFASKYRNAYGEHPSDTLKNSKR